VKRAEVYASQRGERALTLFAGGRLAAPGFINFVSVIQF
jgi:hypothetical protein